MNCGRRLARNDFSGGHCGEAAGIGEAHMSAGHSVVFESEGSYIVNKNSGESNWMRQDNGNYMLHVWIPIASLTDPKIWRKHEAPSGRQP